MSDPLAKYGNEKSMRIASLISGYIEGRLTVAEHKELDEWVNESDLNMQLFEQLTDPKQLDEARSWMGGIDAEAALVRVKTSDAWREGKGGVSNIEGERNEKNRKVSKTNKYTSYTMWLPYAAATIIVLVASIWIYNAFQVEKANPSTGNEPIPGGMYAKLSLPDGKVVKLDSTTYGIVAIGNGYSIRQESGVLKYVLDSTKKPQEFLKLEVPKGGQYHVKLPDGSEVWLNSASSLTYPLNQLNGLRNTIINGEAYFEIAKDSMHPFEVQTAYGSVRVLGTHFNVNVYGDEDAMITTVTEGKVKMIKGNDEIMLIAGNAGVISKEGKLNKLDATALQAIAWKEGKFLYADANIERIMLDIGRWYDADIVYETRPTDHFNLEVDMHVPLKKLLDILEKTGRVKFEVSGKKILVKE